jgi:sulfoxide reductase catalytic subunit YedY
MKRRIFLKLVAGALGWTALAASPLGGWIQKALAQTVKRLLPADTDLATLLDENPAELDTRDLPITPVEKFGTMGASTHRVELTQWRLSIGGAVNSPLTLTYAQLKDLPVIEHDVLLICPGFFAYQARWKGVSIDALLSRAGLDPRANYVDIKGPSGVYQKVERFGLETVRAEAVFLAYAVNGQVLPEKHGFPLRAVAEGRMGSEWVKYADRIEAVIAQAPAQRPASSPGSDYFP